MISSKLIYPSRRLFHHGMLQSKRFFSTSFLKRNLPANTRELDHGRIWLIDNLFTEEECQSYIERAESIGFEDAPIYFSAHNSSKIMKNIRNHQRLVFDDVELAQYIYSKVREIVPQEAYDLIDTEKKEILQKVSS